MNWKEIRTRRNLSQQQVANHIGCSAVAYSRYENRIRQPSIETLLSVADLFDVTVDFLLGRQNVENSTLSKDEIELVNAARNADDRAREDALQILLSHGVDTTKKSQ